MKLDIIGSVASGKTTFAREISIKYQIPFYEKDNIVWERTLNGDKKRLLNCCLNMGQNIELSRIQNKQCNLLKKCIVNKPFSEL